MAEIKLGKVGLTNEGKWNADKPYPILSLVTHKGQAYVSFMASLGKEPSTESAYWMLIAERGESLYQMMVREKLFEGTEAEFLQQYQDVLTEARNVTNASMAQQEQVELTMIDYSAKEQHRSEEEVKRYNAEQTRIADEQTRQEKESGRQIAESERVSAEYKREHDYQNYKSQLETTVQISGEAVAAANAAASEAGKQAGLAEAATTTANEAAKAATATANEAAKAATATANEAAKAATATANEAAKAATATANEAAGVANAAAENANKVATGMEARVSAVENKNVEQDGKLATLEKGVMPEYAPAFTVNNKYINADNENKKFVIPRLVIPIFDNKHLDILATEVPYTNMHSDSGLSRFLVIDSSKNYKIKTENQILRNDLLIAGFRCGIKNMPIVEYFVHSSIPYAINGITFDDSHLSINDRVYAFNILGNNDTPVLTHFYAIKGNRYRITFNKIWNYMPSMGPQYNIIVVWNVKTKNIVYQLSSSVGMKSRDVYFTAEDDDSVYELYIRAAKGENIQGTITDITETRGNSSIIGVNKDLKYNIEEFGVKKRYDDNVLIPSLSILHYSDNHGNKNTLPRIIEFANNYYRTDNGKRGIDIVINSGDTIYSDFEASISDFENYKKSLSEFKPKVYHCLGNHDVSKCPSLEVAYNTYYKPLESYFAFKQGEHEANACYYYKDFEEQKVRVYFDNDYPSLKMTKTFKQNQVDFLIKSLKTTPEGYGFVYVSHQPPALFGDIENEFCSPYLSNGRNKWSVGGKCGTLLPDLIQAFIDRTKINKVVPQNGFETLNIDADFTNCKGIFISYLCGHNHNDFAGHLKEYPKQICIDVNVAGNSYIQGSDITVRTPNTKNGDSFNLVSIDMNIHTITIIRIGAGTAIQGQVRKNLLLQF